MSKLTMGLRGYGGVVADMTHDEWHRPTAPCAVAVVANLAWKFAGWPKGSSGWVGATAPAQLHAPLMTGVPWTTVPLSAAPHPLTLYVLSWCCHSPDSFDVKA
jgi:hypothetical protein